ncbi:tRNA (adenosine(37)-N6)-threonylcarbamoyltransferase complex ATPase subunit type 1 TsaE [Capnocytophaga sp.]|uniref:tRNA (adenosine(37)-N6)-threonylcarbamoyltransferase complex ATPase subunit type 1 TsaE n=1 Tax=Capnocytophaga sp. TaxID=44737 RepID=UPI0026DA8CA8|nr:tRNA (adenosine(37)-N6)-threonylcarbamoyltransferase complex ATPase subunit type 1 TsaE [Capnocytophaga sp.]MDO5105761.1 tRNA (adenosine(37)-N6)-threonylcarbamoyltransferase complex ATPase subunit type 1 TsaE [Capnocytophaga sp.]
MEINYSLSQINDVAAKIIPLLTEKVIVFQGSMGMGKTTFIKALVRALGVDDAVSSPTFGLVNQYENDDVIIYHFDFYRIKHQEEAFDIGFEEYLYSGNWCFIEWAERVSDYLPDRYCILDFEWTDTDSRKLTVKHSVS